MRGMALFGTSLPKGATNSDEGGNSQVTTCTPPLFIFLFQFPSV